MLEHEECEHARIHVTDARSHHKTFYRSETHRSIDTLAVDNGSHGSTVAEAVAAHAVFGVVLIRKGIHICLCRHRLVKCRVEHTYLRHIGHECRNCLDSGHIGRIVKRSDIVALADFCLHIFVDEHALAELLAAMHQTVADSVDFAIAAYAAFLGVGEKIEDSLHSLLMVDQTEVEDILGAVGTLELEESAGETYFLHAALCQSLGLLAAEVDEFIFY